MSLSVEHRQPRTVQRIAWVTVPRNTLAVYSKETKEMQRLSKHAGALHIDLDSPDIVVFQHHSDDEVYRCIFYMKSMEASSFYIFCDDGKTLEATV
jgi:hypothetical protein